MGEKPEGPSALQPTIEIGLRSPEEIKVLMGDDNNRVPTGKLQIVMPKLFSRKSYEYLCYIEQKVMFFHTKLISKACEWGHIQFFFEVDTSILRP